MVTGAERTFRRRRFLIGAAAGAAALALPAWLRPRGAPPLDRALAAPIEPYSRKLPIPREITRADISIPIQVADIDVLPGRKTKMWTYDGTFPGPTIRRPSGERTTIVAETTDIGERLSTGGISERRDAGPWCGGSTR